MKVLVISDIHLKHKVAESILDLERGNFDKCIFLGDYFDDWGDSPEQNAETAIWLKNSLKESLFVHLLGNHDLSYLTARFNYEGAICSGFSLEKSRAINTYLKLDDWFKLRLFIVIDGILYTHAGLNKRFLPQECSGIEWAEDYLGEKTKEYHDWLLETSSSLGYPKKKLDRIFSCGYIRGGDQPYGGIIWNDSREHKPVNGVTQVFGHTLTEEVRKIESDYCIDTNLHHYAIVNDGQIRIKNYE